MLPKQKDPLLGPVGCRVLAGAFLAGGVMQLLIAEIVGHGGAVGEALTVLLPLATIVSAVLVMVGPRLTLAYRLLGFSAAALIGWFVLTWILSLGA